MFRKQCSKVTASGSKKPNIRIITGTIALVMVIALIFIVFIVKNSGRCYVYTTLLKTKKAYSQELGQMINNNTVFKEMKSNLSKSNANQIRTPDLRLKIGDDKKEKVIYAEVKSEDLPFTGRLFLTDTRLIAGVQGLVYLEADSKSLGSDLQSFMGNMGPFDGIEYTGDMAEALDALDLSYSSITDMRVLTHSSDFAVLQKRYTGIVKKLIDKAAYTKNKSTIGIGGKTVTTDLITLTANAKVLGNWLQNELLPVMKQDKDLAKYWRIYGTINQTMDSRYSKQDYDNLIGKFENNLDSILEDMEDQGFMLSVSARVYNGVIVWLAFDMRSGGLESQQNAVAIFSALGDEYRLNDICIEIHDSYLDRFHYISLKGDHIGKDMFTSAISLSANSIKNGWIEQNLSVEWDTKEDADNVRIRAGETMLEGTFALDGNEVVAKYDDFSWRLGGYEASVELPGRTTLIRDTTVADIIEELGSILSFFY